ncbi:MAG: hypothetical protein HOM96_03710 [Rickettsiales bacterium]|nr:hypothetical protein [Rickettsiales bacterium]
MTSAIRIICLLIFLSVSIANSYAGNEYSRRPTAEAVEVDLAYCSPLFASALAIYFIMYSQKPRLTKFALGVIALTAYGVLRMELEKWALHYQEDSYVLNHIDLNNDLYNDYAKWVNLAAINNNAARYNEYLANRNDINWMRIKNVSFCDDLVNKQVIRTDPENGFIYYDVTLSKEDVKILDGCRECSVSDADNVCGGNGLYGFTYEIYNEAYLCNGGVLVYHKGDEKCIEKGECSGINTKDKSFFAIEDYTVCAYKMDELVCSEAVFCSFTIFGDASGGDATIDGEGFKDIGDFFLGYAFDYSPIDGRTHEGKDPTDPGIPAIITCQQLVDEATESTCTCSIEQAQQELCAVGEYYPCSMDNIDTVGTCEFCGDVTPCIDQTTGLFIEPCAVVDNELCGYYPNDEYLRHCALDKAIDLESVYELPDFISKYCTGEAIVDTGNMSISGRAMRCVELSIQNMFFGAFEEADGTNITGIYCSNDNSSVNLRSECKAGIFVQFQDHMHNAIIALMTLSISFLGVMILFGLLPDVKSILSYIVTFALVFYFSLSDGWRDGYYDAVVTAGRTIGMVISSNLNYQKLYGVNLSDGCDFSITQESGDNFVATGSNDYVYPDNEAHYAVWDVYDCKMERFFTSGGAAFSSFGKILTEVIPFGIIIALPVVFFLYGFIFLFLFFTAQFLIFALTAFFVITLLIFISPVIIPLCLLKSVKKAKGIYDAWFKTLIGYSFQPVVLWTILAILAVFMDVALYGAGADIERMFDPNTGAIADNCKPSFLPCIFHKLDIGYYDFGWKAGDSITGLFTAMVDMTLFRDISLAFVRAFFFIGITFMIAMTAMTTISGSLFDAAENANIGEELMGTMKKGGAASLLAVKKAGIGAKNTIHNRVGSGSSGGYFKK